MNVDKVKGYNKREIDVYINDSHGSNTLYIIYPGYNYGYNHPLNFYLTQLLAENNQDYIFYDFCWKKLHESEPIMENYMMVIEEEIKISLQHKLLDAYDNYIIIGKSLGTTANEVIKSIKEIDNKVLKYIWLTPFRNTNNLTKINLDKDYIYVGTEDSFYDESIYGEIESKTNIRKIEHTDHVFNIKNDVLGSIMKLNNVLSILQRDIM